MTSHRLHPLRIRGAALALAVAVLLALPGSARAGAQLPPGWFLSESVPGNYTTYVDTERPCEGHRTVLLQSRAARPEGYASFMQRFRADAFRGKRIRFSAVVRVEDVQGWAGLHMRIDDASHRALAFDNMQSRPLVGSGGCTRHAVVLDVPQDSVTIALGLIMYGAGKVWISDMKFEQVDASVAVTGLFAGTGTPVAEAPMNLELASEPGSPVDEDATGRVGGVWFNGASLDGITRVTRQKDGTWKGVWADMVLRGRTVKGTFGVQEGRFTVIHEDGTTRVEGEWGGRPVRIMLNPERVQMSWGQRSRDLRRSSDVNEEPGCVRYVQEGVQRSRLDLLEVCGEAIGARPPPVQLVLAFLINGFEPRPPVPTVIYQSRGRPVTNQGAVVEGVRETPVGGQQRRPSPNPTQAPAQAPANAKPVTQ